MLHPDIQQYGGWTTVFISNCMITSHNHCKRLPSLLHHVTVGGWVAGWAGGWVGVGVGEWVWVWVCVPLPAEILFTFIITVRQKGA